ncbi:MAG TPA: zinc ribbon domain-containing protein [Steroidobacteraceae bacterium]
MSQPVGIRSFGAYLPRLRLERSAIAVATGWATGTRGAKPRGARSYCAWDEDSLTMAVEAARDCLSGGDRSSLASIAFASTTHPFADRSNAGVVAAALDLAETARGTDAAGNLRAGVGALLQAFMQVRAAPGDALVVAADRRIAKPASEQEQSFGHGAVALRVGAGGDLCAEWLGSSSLQEDFVDHYRASDGEFDYALEERWVRDEGYLKFVPRTIAAALQDAGVDKAAVKHLVVQGPGRFAGAIAKAAGIPADALQDDLSALCGDTGTAHPLLMLGAVLERAAAGEVIVLASFGQGSDALVLRATGRAPSPGRGCRGALASGTLDQQYVRFLANCGLLEIDWGMRAERDNRTAQSVAWRKHRDVTAFIGGRCSACGTVQFPRSRACVNPDCRAFDTQQEIPLAETTGKVKTYTEDWLAVTRSPPHVYGNVALDNGANVFSEFADTPAGTLEVGTPVCYVFRIKDFDAVRGFRRYFWKATPVRT